jgi:hypothetical protein
MTWFAVQNGNNWHSSSGNPSSGGPQVPGGNLEVPLDKGG